MPSSRNAPWCRVSRMRLRSALMRTASELVCQLARATEQAALQERTALQAKQIDERFQEMQQLVSSQGQQLVATKTAAATLKTVVAKLAAVVETHRAERAAEQQAAEEARRAAESDVDAEEVWR